MIEDRYVAIKEEIAECESLGELKAIWCHWEAEWPQYAHDAFSMTLVRVRVKEFKAAPEQEPTPDFTALERQIAELKALIGGSKKEEKEVTVVKSAPRGGRRYQILSTEIKWTEKRQVHALMAVLKAHANVGDILDEEYIIQMMVANEDVLDTTQGGKRIWDYYKGEHNLGLVAHGNLRKV